MSLSKGRAKKGSRFLLQNYINDDQLELNNLILMSSPSLLTFVDMELSIEWKSPLREKDYREYRNEFLDKFSDNWVGKREELEKYWARKGPQWDGVGIVKGKNRQNGLFLVEAKAHLDEMYSKIQAGDVSRAKIVKTIEEVKNYTKSNASLEIWLEQYYQLSNRLAYLYVLNEKIGIPTWLVLVNFVDDTTHNPTGINEWIPHYQSVLNSMGMSSTSNIFRSIISIYPKGVK